MLQGDLVRHIVAQRRPNLLQGEARGVLELEIAQAESRVEQARQDRQELLLLLRHHVQARALAEDVGQVAQNLHNVSLGPAHLFAVLGVAAQRARSFARLLGVVQRFLWCGLLPGGSYQLILLSEQVAHPGQLLLRALAQLEVVDGGIRAGSGVALIICPADGLLLIGPRLGLGLRGFALPGGFVAQVLLGLRGQGQALVFLA